MSSYLKILLLVITSFVLGMMSKFYFPFNHSAQREIHYTQEQRLEIADQQLRKPFFVKVKEGGDRLLDVFKSENSIQMDGKVDPIKSNKDFLFLKEALDNFNDKVEYKIRERFQRSLWDEKDPNAVRYHEGLKSKAELMFTEKELDYKASFTDETTNSKVVLFINFYKCGNSKNQIIAKLSDVCYLMKMYNLSDDIWNETSISSSLDGLYWYKDSPYTYLNLSGLDRFSQSTSASVALVPIPNEQLPIQYLAFKNEKFIWTEANEVRWNVVDEKEAEKFEAWMHEQNNSRRELK